MKTSPRSSKLRLAVLLVSAIFCASSAWTANAVTPEDQTNSLKELSLAELGNLQVTTATKTPAAIWKTPAAIYVITHDAILRSGATSIPDALRLAPGVEVARIDSDKWSIGIRGFGSRLCRSVLVLIDGRTVYTTLLAGTYWEVQDTVMQDIDRIEVIRGPGGTIWGPNAVNGVINVITKPASETQGTLASALGGNVDQGAVTLRQGVSHGPVNYRAYAKGFNRAAQFHSDHREFDHWRAMQGGFRLDWTESSQDGFTLQGDIYDERAGESVVATTYAPPYSQVLDGNALLSGGNILGRWKRTTGEAKGIQLQAFYDRTNRYEPNFTDIRDTFDVDFLQHFPLPGRQEVSWGLGARSSRGKNPLVVSGLTFTPSPRTDTLFSAFLQDDIAIVDRRLSLSLGTKLIKTNFTDVEPEPSVRLLYTPTDTQTLWAAYTHALRTPSDAEENFSLAGFIGIAPNSLPYFARFNPNKNFQPEQLNGYELGYRRLVGQNLYLDLSAFYNHYSSLFSEDITGPPFIETNPGPTHILLPAQFGNGLLGETSGGEIAPEWQVTDFWRLRGSYSFLEIHLKKAPNSLDIGSAPGVEGSSPRHQVLAQSGFDLPKAVSLDLLYRYVSALPGQNVRAYSSADVSLGWNATSHLRFSAVGQNLLQPHHAEFGTDPGPLVQIKRSAYAQITWQK
ncbi:MAG TPA: TonB-dependent receptor [Candidatus Sulfotelmatobacter sp.]|nr:TonB-dependent receptor [Candidatus Sulfotelmatobacter sp.]